MLTFRSTQAEVLAELARKARSYLEVGVQEGRSLALVLTARPAPARLVLCDDWGTDSGGTGRGSHEHLRPLLEDFHGEVEFLDGDSRETLPRLLVPFDLVHIDGGHSYEVASSDLQHGWRLCRRWMLVHDITFPEVWRALCEFAQGATGPMTVEVYFGGHGTAVVRRAEP